MHPPHKRHIRRSLIESSCCPAPARSPTLIQICHHTQLPQKTVKQTLVVLIQQHLVVHFSHIEGGNNVCYYECNWTQAYELLHAGRIIRTVEEIFGTDGALIASNMLQLGHARVSDFLAAYGISTKKAKKARETEGPTIEADAPISSVETLKEVMMNMLRDRYLVEVKQHHVQSKTDVENVLRADLIQKLRKNFTSELKLMKEVNVQLRAKLKEMEIGDTAVNNGLKRKAAPPGGRAKKRKKVSIYDDEEEEVEWEIDENLVLRINHDKFLVVFRNAELVSLAEQRVGKVSAQVYGEFLKRIEPKIFRCRNNVGEDEDTIDDEAPQKNIKLSCLELSRNFNPDIDLEGSIALPPKEVKSKPRKRSYSDSDDDGRRRNGSSKPNGKHHHDSDEEDEESDEVDEWAENNDEDMDPEAVKRKNRMKLIKQHLMLLAEDSFRFLQSEGNRGMGEWSVNYKELGKTMRSIELERVVEERFESVGTRLLRIIKDKGKLDEKQIANIALLKQNQIRAVLSGMQECGHLELQEVPRSIPPQVNRTYFLWYFDEQRANALLLSDVYKAMSRNMQRTMVEKQKRKHLIEKSERSDVKANYEEYMTKNEKRELEIWRTREERLLVQLMRLDRIVMILRDF
ncbi:hypothetical protein K440DRAFT_664871 [Wilcoxina mikolae CBS 423.85]|nr:hypothetical protein K440DRAFT_664871 [Wilcoxina mikolae CBS 423.85]